MPNFDELYKALTIVYKNTGVYDKIGHSPWGVFTEARVFDVITEEQYGDARKYFMEKKLWYKREK